MSTRVGEDTTVGSKLGQFKLSVAIVMLATSNEAMTLNGELFEKRKSRYDLKPNV